MMTSTYQIIGLYLLFITSKISIVIGDTTVSSLSSNLRGGRNALPLLVNDDYVLCRVVTLDTMYFNETSNTTFTNEQITCIPIVKNVELEEFEFPITLPTIILTQYEKEIMMGTLLVEISDAMIDNDDLVTSLQSQYSVVNATQHNRHLISRHLQIKPVMTVAVIRITTSDAQPTQSASQIKSTLFNANGINFVTQYNAISYGKLVWSLSSTGVIDIQVPNSVASYGTATALVTAAQKLVKSQYQVSEVSALADRVMMCLPPGTGNWAASAGVNHWRAQFNNDWCTSLSGTMHELGHTMGLLHAQANGVEYADRSGYMGSGYTSSTSPRKGFEGYNSWQFGWYSDRHFIIYPKTDGSRLVKVASFVDYKKAATDEYVVLNINDQYYLMYNTQKGFNIDTEQKQNQVTVTEGLSTGTNSLAGLSVGGTTFTVSNYQGSGQALIVEACKTMTGSSGASIMQISIALGKSVCGTTDSTQYEEQNTSNSGNRSAFLRWIEQVKSRIKSRLGSF